MAAPASVDEYIASFEEPVRSMLGRIRQIIREVIPSGTETISYGIPTINLDGKYVVYFAGWKRYVSLYPIPALDPDMESRIARYRSGKGTLQLPIGEPMPEDLIRVVVTVLAERRN